MPRSNKTSLSMAIGKPLSPFQAFCRKWGGGCGAAACSGRGTRVVLARGSVPCDVLVVAEAPGESENVIGRPMVGPAGRLMDRVLRDALGGLRYCVPCLRGNAFRQFPSRENPTLCDNGHGEEDAAPFRVGYCNLVGCIPRDPAGGKAAEPDADQIEACIPRLEEFIKIARPRLIVRAGKHAESWIDPRYQGGVRISENIALCSVVHPAAVLRANIAQRGLLIQKMIVTISTAAEALGC